VVDGHPTGGNKAQERHRLQVASENWDDRIQGIDREAVAEYGQTPNVSARWMEGRGLDRFSKTTGGVYGCEGDLVVQSMIAWGDKGFAGSGTGEEGWPVLITVEIIEDS
jgi:hypothetical protein